MNYFLLKIGKQFDLFYYVFGWMLFLQSLKMLHMQFLNKNVPEKWDEMFIWVYEYQSEI